MSTHNNTGKSEIETSIKETSEMTKRNYSASEAMKKTSDAVWGRNEKEPRTLDLLSIDKEGSGCRILAKPPCGWKNLFEQGEGISAESDDPDGGQHPATVTCVNCAAGVCGENEAGAIIAWNTRTDISSDEWAMNFCKAREQYRYYRDKYEFLEKKFTGINS